MSGQIFGTNGRKPKDRPAAADSRLRASQTEPKESGTIHPQSATTVSRTSRLLYWLTLSFLAVVAGVTLLQSARQIGTVFPGFRVLSDGRLHNAMAPWWTGASVDLPWLRRVVAIDGVPVGSGRAMAERVAAIAPGTPVTYTIATEAGYRVVTVPTQRLGLHGWLATNLISWILGVGTALCGAVVSWLKPGHPVARLHFAGCMLMGAYHLFTIDATTTHLVTPTALYMTLHAAAFGAWGLLATVFPRHLPAKTYWQAGWIGGTALLIAWCLADTVTGQATGMLATSLGWAALAALALPASAAWSVWRSGPESHDRAVGQVLLLGFGVPFLVTIAAGWSHSLLGQPPAWVTFSYLSLLAFPVTIAYAIVRHRLFGIETLLRQTAYYTLTAGGMLVVFAVVTGAIRLALGERSQTESALAAMAVALAFGPWRDRVKAWLDRRFFRTTYDLVAILSAFHRRASAEPVTDRLLAVYAALIEEALAVSGVHVHLSSGAACRDGDVAAGIDVPLTLEGERIGEARIGPKRSDLPFSAADHELIGELSRRLELWLHLVSRIETERRHQDTIAALRHADEMKSQFLNLVSHELRRPLSEILAAVHLLSHYGGQAAADEPSRRHLTQLQASASMLTGLVNDLLDAEQLQSGRFHLRPAPLDVAHVVDDAVNTVRAVVAQKGLHLHVDAPASLTAWGDHLRLVQVISNLLVNAIRHTDPDGAVSVRVAETADGWCGTVTDTGEGIPAASLPHLFQRFGTVDRSDRRAGIGLGLYICKSIIEAHAGTIILDSTPGAGTTVVFTVPLQPPPPDPLPADRTSERSPHDTPA